MKEVVILSLIFAILCTGFGELADWDNSANQTTSSHSITDVSTSAKASHASLQPTTGASFSVTTDHGSTHAVTTSFINPTTNSPKPNDLYFVKYTNGSYCILIKANISIAVNYINSADNKTASGVVSVPAPGNVTVTGSCNEDGRREQWITISFNINWNLTLRFEKPDGKYFQSSLSLDWDLRTSNIKNTNESGHFHVGTHLFETSTGYLCMARKTLYFNSSVVNDVSGIYTEKLQLEAFQMKGTPKFNDKYERCSEDSISNLVPIIVGACLGGLIVIVLIAYLIGRKRSRRGYESV